MNASASIRLPKLTWVRLEDVTLYNQQPAIEATIEDGVFCLAGANGLGKSTFLAALNFGLTGIVAQPGRRYDSVEEYYQDSLGYSAEYFKGRVSDTDRATANVTLHMRVASRIYHVTRNLFEPKALRRLHIENEDGTGVLEHPPANDFLRQEEYERQLAADTGLSFAQLAYLQHFVLTFDERRNLLFWDEKAIQQVLFIAFGLGSERAQEVERYRRERERCDSLIRNLQWRIGQARSRLAHITRQEAQVANVDGTVLRTHAALGARRDDLVTQERALLDELSDVQLLLADASSAHASLRKAYETAFLQHVDRRADPSLHPVVVEALNEARCLLCGNSGSSVTANVRQRLAANICPFCQNELTLEHDEDRGFGELTSLDVQLQTVGKRLEDAQLAYARVKEQLGSVAADLAVVDRALADLERENQALALLSTPTSAAGALAGAAQQCRVEIADRQQEKDELLRARTAADEHLKMLLTLLTDAYASAEHVFVPLFTEIAHRFLGLDLEIRLDVRPPDRVSLVLSVDGKPRRLLSQLSESQRYFIEIALRMALARYMTNSAHPPTLYIDTPEGSLDIAYEQRAGDMFGQFARDGNHIVMTANINTSQLLLQLARRCGAGLMHLHRMTEWTVLSEVQAEAHELFESAYDAIELALAKGQDGLQ